LGREGGVAKKTQRVKRADEQKKTLCAHKKEKGAEKRYSAGRKKIRAYSLRPDEKVTAMGGGYGGQQSRMSPCDGKRGGKNNHRKGGKAEPGKGNRTVFAPNGEEAHCPIVALSRVARKEENARKGPTRGLHRGVVSAFSRSSERLKTYRGVRGGGNPPSLTHEALGKNWGVVTESKNQGKCHALGSQQRRMEKDQENRTQGKAGGKKSERVKRGMASKKEQKNWGAIKKQDVRIRVRRGAVAVHKRRRSPGWCEGESGRGGGSRGVTWKERRNKRRESLSFTSKSVVSYVLQPSTE